MHSDCQISHGQLGHVNVSVAITAPVHRWMMIVYARVADHASKNLEYAAEIHSCFAPAAYSHAPIWVVSISIKVSLKIIQIIIPLVFLRLVILQPHYF